MTERPILFSAPMVRALLAGTKTQTRRALRVQPPAETFAVSTCHHPDPRPHFYAWVPRDGGGEISEWPPVPCPFGAPGDRLWVREAFAVGESQAYDDGQSHPVALYRASVDAETDANLRWKPSIHMPRRFSRISLEVVAVRVERLQAISEADAWAEGCKPGTLDDNGNPFPAEEPMRFGTRGWDCARDWYADLWDEINGPDAWDADPWVWVVEFKRCTPA